MSKSSHESISYIRDLFVEGFKYWPLLLPLILLLPTLNAFPYPSPSSAYSDLAVTHLPNALFLRRAIFEAYFGKGEDIGRVDRLVALAVALGLDRTAVKASLDVDRYQEDVARARAEAVEAGNVDTPSIATAGGILRGFHNREALGSLLGGGVPI